MNIYSNLIYVMLKLLLRANSVWPLTSQTPKPRYFSLPKQNEHGILWNGILSSKQKTYLAKTEEPIQSQEDSNHSKEEQNVKRPLRFCRWCCSIKIGLIVCHISLFCIANLHLLVGFKNLADIITNSFLLAYVFMGLIVIITCKLTRRGMVLISLITLPVMAACIASNILQLTDLASNLDP